MANAFDGQSFSRVLVDAERLANRAIDHERRLTELVSTMERAVASRANGGKPGEWLDAVRQVCVAARDQRQAAGAIVARLASDVHRDRGHSRGGVLVVDDSEDNREIAALALEASGFHATTAANGLEGVIVAHYASPLVVLMDIAMPVLGGIEAARLLKASAVTSAIPVLAYTAVPLNVAGWLTRLFVDVVRKPVSPDGIVAAVRRFATGAESPVA